MIRVEQTPPASDRQARHITKDDYTEGISDFHKLLVREIKEVEKDGINSGRMGMLREAVQKDDAW